MKCISLQLTRACFIGVTWLSCTARQGKCAPLAALCVRFRSLSRAPRTVGLLNHSQCKIMLLCEENAKPKVNYWFIRAFAGARLWAPDDGLIQCNYDQTVERISRWPGEHTPCYWLITATNDKKVPFSNLDAMWAACQNTPCMTARGITVRLQLWMMQSVRRVTRTQQSFHERQSGPQVCDTYSYLWTPSTCNVSVIFDLKSRIKKF